MKQYREEIEHYGVLMEKMGLSPVAARIFIYLLLCPEGEATFDEMVSYFKVSKSAVSNALKLLSYPNIVGYRTKPGQRKRYFYIDTANWMSLQNALGRILQMRDILENLLKLRKAQNHFSAEIRDISGFMSLLEKEYPVIYEKWKKSKAVPGGRQIRELETEN